jgi:hypothetical protein
LTGRVAGVAGLYRIALLAGVLGICLTACGEGGPLPSGLPSSLPSLTRSPAAEPPTSVSPQDSRTLPTRSEAPPANPTTSPPAPPNPTTTRVPVAPATQTAAPAPIPIPAPTQTATPRATPTPAAASATVPPAAAEPSSSSSPWLWALLGLLAALTTTALVVWLVRANRAKKDWQARLAGAVTESTWLAHDLLPSVFGVESPAARRNMWTASRPRVEMLERSLGELMGSAPQDQLGGVNRLRTTVTDLSSAMDAYAASGLPDDRESLGAARLAQRQLEEALRALQTPPAQGAGAEGTSGEPR